ncbi:MAG: N-acetylmuramoyl-L-alanine amidase [Caulobacterales bacterium]
MESVRFIERPSRNFDSRGGCTIDLVVLHYTGMKDAETALKRLTDPAPIAGNYPGPWQDPNIDPAAMLARVSAHYVVGGGGEIYRVVSEAERAWHAGVSSWEGRSDTNARAIGIEIANGGHDYGLPAYTDAQIAAVIALAGDILKRNALAPSRVVGHSDVAPARKDDPGEHFPWQKLVEAGVAIWPKIAAPVADARAAFTAFGYDPNADLDAVTRAFQRRFRQDKVDGVLDDETLALLGGLA